jgi:hypothetical protein
MEGTVLGKDAQARLLACPDKLRKCVAVGCFPAIRQHLQKREAIVDGDDAAAVDPN